MGFEGKKNIEIYNLANLQYGDGSDGNVTISSNTTLSRPMYYDTLTVNPGITLSTFGYPIYCKTACINNGIISMVGAPGNGGGNGTVSTGGASGTTGTNVANHFSGGLGAIGGAGGNITPSNGTAGAVAPSLQVMVNNNRNPGGNGGAGTNAGGSGGIAATITYYPVRHLTHWYNRGPVNIVASAPGHGGGGGGGSLAGGGGGGGASGNTPTAVFVAAKSLTNGSGIIRSKGGDGGRGGNGFGNGGGGGGGAAAHGGIVCLVYNSLISLGTIDVSAGTPGAPGNGAGTGSVGIIGSSGSPGKIIQFNLITGTIITT